MSTLSGILVMLALAAEPAVFAFTMNSLDGKPVKLSKYAGRVVLVVNVASECGYTPQYAGLQELHKRFSSRGLSVLGFPSNDFGQQEPGSDSQIATFCQTNYGVQFDMFSKVQVTGTSKTGLYGFLTSAKTNPRFAGEVSWNFEKFLIGKDGSVLARFRSDVEPTSPEVVAAVEAALK